MLENGAEHVNSLEAGSDDRRLARRLRLASLAVLLVALAASALFWRLGPCDDDFIAQRYARNLVEGAGLVFNPGERVEGYTCPLWVGLHAGSITLGLEPAIVGRLVGVLAFLACVAIALWRARYRSPLACTAAATGLALSAALAFHAALGLGTVLAAACIASAFVVLERAERLGVGGALAALGVACAALLRPETVLFAPFVLWAVPRGSRVRCAAVLLLLVGGWIAFRRVYYGEWLPNTYHVKKLGLADDLVYGTAYLGRATFDTGIAVLLLVAGIARAWGLALRDRASTAMLAGAVATTAAVLWSGGDYMELARFLVPVLPVAAMLACDAVAALFAERPLVARAALLVVASFGAWPHARVGALDEGHRFNEERWIAIGEDFARSLPPGSRVALSPIGAIGWHSRAEIVDLLGLTSSALRDAEPDLAITMKGHHRHDANWALAQEPDLFVLGNGVVLPGQRTLHVNQWEEAIVRHPRFAVEYEQRVMPIAGSYELFAFQRRADAPRTRPRAPSESGARR